MSSEKDKSHYWVTMLECIDHGIRGDSTQCRQWAEKFLAELEKHGDDHAAGILNGLLADPAGRQEAAIRGRTPAEIKERAVQLYHIPGLVPSPQQESALSMKADWELPHYIRNRNILPEPPEPAPREKDGGEKHER